MPSVKQSSGWRMLVLGLVTTSFIGCFGPSDPLNRQAVTGEVLLKNVALDTGSISFTPVDMETGRPAGATIAEGNFSIAKEQGLPPGTYTVRVNSADESAAPVLPEGMPGDSRKLAPDRIPPSWNAKSEETITVEDGGENHFVLSIP